MRHTLLQAGLTKLKSCMPKMAGCNFKTSKGIEEHAHLGHSSSNGIRIIDLTAMPV